MSVRTLSGALVLALTAASCTDSPVITTTTEETTTTTTTTTTVPADERVTLRGS